MKFRKKPVVIDAIQWKGCNHSEVAIFLEGHTSRKGEVIPDMAIIIPTLEGEMRAEVGDWIIKGIKGEFYPCKPDIFAQTYQPAAAVSQDKAECEARIKEIFKEIEDNWSWVVNPLIGEDFSKRAGISYNQWKNIKAKYLGKQEGQDANT